MQFSTWYFCCPDNHRQCDKRKAPCSRRTNTGCRVCGKKGHGLENHMAQTRSGISGQLCCAEGVSPWWPLLGPISWYPIFRSSHCNSTEDRAPVDFIYVARSSDELQRLDYMMGYQDSCRSNGHQGDMPYCDGTMLSCYNMVISSIKTHNRNP